MTWLITEMWSLLFVAFALGVSAGAWVITSRRRNFADRTSSTKRTSAAAPAILLDAPDGPKDDLTQIIGIDQKTEKKLNDLGIFHLRQIAGWDEGASRWIEIRLNEPGRATRERWSEQASSMV
jgi:predicted flap endonuclease-1-like 5' DNA nuclease